LFEVVAGPLAQPRTPGVCFAGMRTVAFDGLNSLKISDTERNRCWIGRIWYRLAFAGYPTLRLMCLVETGTRGLLGAVIGGAIGTPGDRDEAHLARRLLRLLGPDMLLLADRAFDCATFLAEVNRTGAKLLVRAGCSRKPAVLRHLPDGSYLSQLGGLPVRIIEAALTVRGADGTTVGDHYRLITTLLDDHRFPAARLIRLYHERWEIETAYLALRHTMLDGAVLRSADRPGVEQEVWALLTLYQLVRTAMVEAVETRPGLGPDRASFTTALQTARDQLLTAPGIDPDPTTDADRLGAIGQAVLTTLLPARRPRYSNRNVKCTTSRYCIRLRRPRLKPTTRSATTSPLLANPARRRCRPAGSWSLRSCSANPAATGTAGNSPPNCTSSSTTCSPSSLNGPAWASSAAPAPAPTPSTAHPRTGRLSTPPTNSPPAFPG
jgi:Transposase DDE domain